MKIIDLNKKYWQWTTLIVLSVIWGTSFILMKRGLESYSAMQVGSLRIFFSSIFLLPFLFKRLKKFKKKDIKSLLVVGVIGNLLPAYLFATAQTEVSSSLAGMLNSAFPIFALLISVIIYKSKTTTNEILGIIVGFAGSVGIVMGSAENFFEGNNWYAILVFLAIIFYAISINTIKHNLPELDGVTITIFSFMPIGAIAGISLLFSDFSTALATPNYLNNLGYLVLLALLSSAIAVTIFYRLIDFSSVVFASSVTYIIPVFAILWGLFDGEQVTVIQTIFMAVCLLGVYISDRK